MIFHSAIFLFGFLPIVFLLYYCSKVEYRNYIILGLSIFFYTWGEPKFVPVVILSSVCDWVLGKGICSSPNLMMRKLYLGIAVFINIGILVIYKYLSFLLDSIAPAIKVLGISSVPHVSLLLPIGVSFIVFEKITYVVDLYRGDGVPAKTLSSYLTYIFLFPKLLAGPIVKYHDIAPQLEQRVYEIDSVLAGINRFVLGLAKKVFLADTMAEIADKVFLLAPHELGFFNAWLGLVCFTFQIYFDFSAYSDMALGLARAFGFDLQENFNMPYASASFTEFWRRWHISLSTWIRDYLYRPLGGNRKGKLNTYFNLWVCFLLSGLWHGANWSFVVWGAYHGFFLVLEKIFGLKWQKLLPIQVNRIITMFLVMLGWGIFRARDINHAHYYIKALFDPFDYYGKFIYVSNNIIFFLGLSWLITIVQWVIVDLNNNMINIFPKNAVIYERVAIICLLLLVFGKIAISTYNPFLYFRF